MFIFLAMATALATPQYQVIYRFQGGTDGYSPAASLIADNSGNLYGTTAYGGMAEDCELAGVQGCGTVFRLTPPATTGGPWTETVLYRFQGGSDGAFPMYAMVADKAGNLYGTTSAGGSANCGGGCGTVFELQRPSAPGGAWTEGILYTFLGVPGGRGDGDPADPNGLAFDKSGNLFGMAYDGGHCRTDETGTYCYGAVYELSPGSPGASWNETVLHRFRGPTGAPGGPTLDKAGNLYGRAIWGSHGFGMIFSLASPASGGTGVVDRTYSFHGGSDARFPEPGLVFDKAGRLFGTSFGGGSTNAGTLFRLDPPAQSGGAWRESVLYSFVDGGAGGNTPNGELIIGAKGQVYGTTQYGGSGVAGGVFELSPPARHGELWTETVLHTFSQGTSDGAFPLAGLTPGGDSALYGTTSLGGAPDSGLCPIQGQSSASCGVVFRIVP